MPPRSEDLDHRVIFERATLTTGGQGDAIEVWSDYFACWAGRRDSSAIETFRAREIEADLSVRFTVRSCPETRTLTPKDRVRLETGETYNISGVRETARNQWIEIDAARRADK